MWRRGDPHRGTSAPRLARVCRTEQRADRWAKGGATGGVYESNTWRARTSRVLGRRRVPWEGARGARTPRQARRGASSAGPTL
jgi:hypothetical protein